MDHEFQRRWAPTLGGAGDTQQVANLHPVQEARPAEAATSTEADSVPSTPTAPPEQGRAFVTTVGGRTLISAPATAITEWASHLPAASEIAARHLMWMSGRFVGAEEPNKNGAFWSAGDLELAQASVVNGPLNWLHEARHVIGTLARAEYVPAPGAQLTVSSASLQPTKVDKWPVQVTNDVTVAATSTTTSTFNGTFSPTTVTASVAQPHIVATAAIWRWIWPDEAYVIEQASGMGKLWYSMECVSKEVACAGPNGCGRQTSYEDYLAGATCEHVVQRASIRRFVEPTFLGGAVIVPPASPGWAAANAAVLHEVAGATQLAEAAFEQAGQPDVPASEWELMMAQVLDYAHTPTGR